MDSRCKKQGNKRVNLLFVNVWLELLTMSFPTIPFEPRSHRIALLEPSQGSRGPTRQIYVKKAAPKEIIVDSQDSNNPHSPPVPSPPGTSSFPPRNTYFAPSISVSAHQRGYTALPPPPRIESVSRDPCQAPPTRR
jgi:hypothetical protein